MAAFKGILKSPMVHELVSCGHVAQLVHRKCRRLGPRARRQVNGGEWEVCVFAPLLYGKSETERECLVYTHINPMSSFSASQGANQDNGFYPVVPVDLPAIDAVADARPAGFSDRLAGLLLLRAGHPMAPRTDQVVREHRWPPLSRTVWKKPMRIFPGQTTSPSAGYQIVSLSRYRHAVLHPNNERPGGCVR